MQLHILVCTCLQLLCICIWTFRFQKEHRQGGTYSDNYGVLFYTAIYYLKVDIYLVSKESTGQPVTLYK